MKKTKTDDRALHAAILALWGIVNVWIAHGRSAWMDELARYEEVATPVKAGLKTLLEEASPFVPGELLLGYVARGLFSRVATEEVWGRLPSLLFGGLTLWLALRMRKPVVAAVVFFSAAVTAYSTEFRPYSALLFAGALSFFLLWERKRKLTRFESALTWFTIFFTHLYGICFVGMACFFRRDWAKAAAAALYVVAFLGVYMSYHHGGVGDWTVPAQFPGWGGTIKQTLGNLANPHKASYLIAPLFAVGAWRLWAAGERERLGWLALLLAVTIGAPMLAVVVGRYVFYPRQIVGAVFPFLFVAALGLEWLAARARLPKLALPAGTAVMAVTWFLTSVLHVPPFVNVAFHTYNRTLQHAVAAGSRNIFIFDIAGTFKFYLPRRLGREKSSEMLKAYGMTLLKQCWENGACTYSLQDSKFMWGGEDALVTSKDFDAFLRDRAFAIDRIIYGMPRLALETPIPSERTF
ncbi:MAG: hypothetical protein HY075_02010 [Deltaproteobacteria bacterium]|nr:hypothetical protein [Deltaproteobacteria bacterium]